jgi:predicted nucleic acid-binding protein
MKNVAIIDTGPLVSLLDRRDKDHAWIKSQWNRLQPPLLTCESVISEVCFLLRSDYHGVAALMEMVRRRILRVDFHLDNHLESIALLLKKYANVPMSLADACLVRMAETIPNGTIVTLDADFRIYRKSNRTVIPTIMPEE